MSKNNNSPETNSGISRRRFLVGVGGVAGGLAIAGSGLATLTPGEQMGVRIAAGQTLKTDMDVLQFALTLEHLEDAAYRAVNASGILKGTPSDLFKAFGDHEHTHVVVLTDVITKMGGKPVQPQAKYNLPKIESQDQVLRLFTTIEEVGAGAYLGAAPLLKDKNLLGAAASIHNVEAQHASTLKAFMNDPMPSPAFGKPMTADEVLAAVKPFLEVPTGAAPPAGGYTNVNPAASLAIAMTRVDNPNVAGMLYFPETGHTLSGPFQDYYRKNGALSMFGFPISEPFRGTNPTDGREYVQQYFQRARLEWHPEHKGTQYEVQLGLLGAEQVFKDMMGGR